MKKITKYAVLITMMLCMSVASKAYDFKDGDCYYTITSLSDLTVALTNSGERIPSESWDTQYAACYSGDFVVPQTAEYAGRTFRVTSIEECAFQNCFLEKLTIPSSVISVSYIKDAVIQKLIVEDSNIPMSKLKVNCAKDVYMGRDIAYSTPFFDCFSSSNIEAIEFGDSVTNVPHSMCWQCMHLVKVKLSANVKKIGPNAFDYCTKLKTISGEGIESIETHAFSDCSSLESFNFPNLMDIGIAAFQGCTSLATVELADGLTYIDIEAFGGCSSLGSVKIPGTIIKFGNIYSNGGSAFTNCPKLSVISIAAKTPIFLPESTFDAQTYINSTLKVPAGSLEAYKNAEIWKNFFNIEEDASLVTSVSIVTVENHNADYGTVEFLGKIVDSYDPIMSKVPVGETITIKFNPKSGCCIREVLVNETDWTSKVVNNSLTIEKVEGNITIDVDFEEQPIYLTIKQADNGSVKLKISKWDEYKFIFSPEPGWDIHSVSFNGEDVTGNLGQDNSFTTPEMSSNSELIVTYVENANAVYGVKDNRSKVNVIGAHGCIIVSNATEGDRISVYSLSGELLHSSTASYGKSVIDVKENNVYIVKVANTSFKIGM